MHSLPLFHRIAQTRVVVVGDGAMADAKKRLIERAGGIPCAETEIHHARLGFVALEDERAAEQAALRLKRAGLLVNVADRPDLCDFTLPSVLDRDPVLVAVSTGGASAGLAKHLRLRLEALIPQSLGELARKLAGLRERMREKFPEMDQRRRAIDEALGQGGPLDVLDAGSSDKVESWLDGDAGQVSDQTVEIVLRSDEPDDLTLGQARLLGMADTVLHDPEVSEAILVRARADAARAELPEGKPGEGLTLILRNAD
ncbi:precorrin-2 dehydrogenase/sirohydrochlorin ferrochelatase family protein [Qipengyuania vesicularis]|uniref:precorrin-2 dehydrogenase/sirohydrochlorin ferrochelatase family protein n=1 Tax=Qipengyuania vesicularis TaxID=2867232 RepID=UPI001C8819C4|nr:NAD(P)-dependent oxidoreductase [Qipengyuania vesicularis]MBX7526163.1 bifunctional precorrin-2 dehydrogenase/sirohydrochlorin ferrochelatase [Qipengyuania vesicularis]